MHDVTVPFHTFRAENGTLTWTGDGETLRIEPWGDDAVRVRARLKGPILDADWALLPPVGDGETPCFGVSDISICGLEGGGVEARLTNGGIVVVAIASADGAVCRLSFERTDGTVLLREADAGGALRFRARDHTPLDGGGEQLAVTFDAEPGEHLYGMGEYQQPVMDLKGSTLELAHRNSQISVPFVLSSRGYGFLWHNPAVGRVTFAANATRWECAACDQMDYWICAGDTPAAIERRYADATGHAPAMPEWGLGFWQCKLRYWNQEQLLDVAREFKRRSIPIDVIVIDYFHWPLMGDFRFDPEFWPDPRAMVDELHAMGIKVMASVWPEIDLESENYDELRARNYLVKAVSGKDVGKWWPRDCQYFDATNPEARDWLWSRIQSNYTDLGIDAFWLDEAEPEWRGWYGHYLLYAGPVTKVGNVYPVRYNETFYEGQRSIGREGEIVNLTRAAWAGSQRYGALVWSGDVHSTFADLKAQITCAIHMGVAGIPWFTTDMGGFTGGDPQDPAFRELYVRWCQFSCFSPVMRNHGDRVPATKVPASMDGPVAVDRKGLPIDHIHTGADNEPWSFGPEVERIIRTYIGVREAMRPYLRDLFDEAHRTGQPLVRGLFFEFPGDEIAANVADEYLFGPDLLVAPVTEPGARARSVYLPGGSETTWTLLHDGAVYEGGQRVGIDARLDVIPVFARNGADHGLAGLF